MSGHPARMMPFRGVMMILGSGSKRFRQHAVHALLPARQVQAKGGLQLAGVEARV